MIEQETVCSSSAANRSGKQADSSPAPRHPSSPIPIGKDSAERPWSGRTLGEYEIGDLIGKGGNGEVYRGAHRWLDRGVAIKFLIGVRADDTETADRFRREAQVAAKLIHPNIVRATDGGVVGQQLFLVTDLVNGCDLSELVKRHSRLSVADVCELGVQAATALGFVAAQNTVHRDVKPSNLMLDHNGTVKLLDLGLARSMDHGDTMTATGQVMGTIDFMAPEQATDPRRVDHRADMYSLGCTLYFLLVGKAPFSTNHLDTLAAKLLATMESDPMPIKKFRRDVPAKLIRLIESMLDKEPNRRPIDFQAVIETLKTYAVGANLPLLTVDSTQPTNVTRDDKPSIASHVEDFVSTSSRTTGRLILRALGFLEPIPVMRPGQRQSYRFSFRWLKVVALVAGFAGFLWFTGFRIYTIDSPTPRGIMTPASSQGSTSGVQYNAWLDS